ncbi:50S ribosomal protein L18a [Natrinema zhouii]|jgi:large subunit ribosomal protein LX|uniref:Large ribosomal subunit protein eL20 n=1 Tax=Natrinema zhouii TaxID=1710539 RepID=A0A7D6CP17_9EURY|nr:MULTISPECIES: 50S ribosomal protein L18Ae [Natrinema]QLK24691.1 50S ribosomal protein L18a [Natrinema zhouii]
MSQFTVSGRFKSRDGFAEFETTIDAQNENVAREHTLSQFGSQHGLKRSEIELDEVSEQ